MTYRSPHLKKGAFSRLGSLHVHVDGLPMDPLVALVRQLEENGFPGKMHEVSAFIEGPQRTALPETYQAHTTGFQRREDFASFSTALLAHRRDISRVLGLIFEATPRNQGVVVELEKVCAHVTPDGVWEQVDIDDIPDLGVDEVDVLPSATLPIEIHHMIDLPASSPPLPLSSLLTRGREAGLIPFGGWFSFQKDGDLAYRSNSFSDLEGIREKVLREYEWVRRHPALIDRQDLRQRTLVERVLGVWRV